MDHESCVGACIDELEAIPLPMLHVIKVLTKDYVVSNERSFARVHGFGVPRLISDAKACREFWCKKIRSLTCYKRFSGVCVRLLVILKKNFWAGVDVLGYTGHRAWITVYDGWVWVLVAMQFS